MRISVKVKPNSKKEKIIPQKDGSLKIWVKQPAREGLANEAACAALAKHFSVPKSAVRIVLGFKSTKKVVEIVQRKP